jgi:predicted AlkP superfamily pyrophosphatase or phosphodiesterase
MKISRPLSLALALALVCLSPQSTAAPVKKPKLVVLIVLDQFRHDFLVRHREHFQGGLKRLTEGGAVFSNAHYDHFPTVTAVGHSTILTGAIPAISGIVENEWWDPAARTAEDKLGSDITSVQDVGTTLLGIGETKRIGASPRRLMASTVGDELRMAYPESKTIGISLKDRSAILPLGHSANAAYWFDSKTGSFVSSTYYFKEGKGFPAWVNNYNAGRPADRWVGKPWNTLDEPNGKPLLTLPSPLGPKYYEELTYTTFGNDLLEEFAERVLLEEKLGKDEITDFFTVSFSSNDLVGHRYGPDSPHVEDVTIRTDRLLAKFFALLDREVGLKDTIIILTSDHGIAPMPEALERVRMPGGRLPKQTVIDFVDKTLADHFKIPGKYVAGKGVRSMYLNEPFLQQNKVSVQEAERVAAAALRRHPHIYRVYTRTDLLANRVGNDPIDQKVRNGFYPTRSGHLFVIADPYFTFGTTGIDHGSPFSYDTSVPIVFWGLGIKPGTYPQYVRVNDIAPTLATMLELPMPSGSVGRPLVEALAPVTPARASTAAPTR